MMPPTKIRVLRYNRSEKLDYIKWLITETGLHQYVTEGDFSYLRTRQDIDNAMMSHVKPTWVEAAEEVVEMVEEEEIIVPDDSPFEEEMDYDSWTQKELQDECRQRGLTIRGTKAEVVLRLRRDDDGIVEQETEDETEAPSEESEAAEEELDAPSEESEAVTEEVTDNGNSGETSNTDEEE
jgi:hypothetical protein